MNNPFYSQPYYYTFGPHPPGLQLMDGGEISVVCPDGDNYLSDGSQLPRNHRQQSQGSALFEGNPLAGPIDVQDVTVGDTLAIDIVSVELASSVGATLLAPDHGLTCRSQRHAAEELAEPPPRHLYRWDIDFEAREARLQNPLGGTPLAVPLRPIIGSLGTCPDHGEHLSSLQAGDFGGNLDLPIIEPGATVLLPVFHPGGHLFVGDLHAAQGNGEVVGGGIEVSGVATIRIRRIAARTIEGPMVLSNRRLYAVATTGELRDAVRLAFSRLATWISDEGGWNRWDVYQVLAQAGRVELGGVVVPRNYTVAAGISLDLFPETFLQGLHRWHVFAGP